MGNASQRCCRRRGLEQTDSYDAQLPTDAGRTGRFCDPPRATWGPFMVQQPGKPFVSLRDVLVAPRARRVVVCGTTGVFVHAPRLEVRRRGDCWLGAITALGYHPGYQNRLSTGANPDEALLTKSFIRKQPCEWG